MIKKHITDETKTPLLVRGLKTFKDNGYTNRSKLPKEEDYLNFLLYLECLSYTRNNTNIIISDLKEKTNNGELEELLFQKLNEKE